MNDAFMKEEWTRQGEARWRRPCLGLPDLQPKNQSEAFEEFVGTCLVESDLHTDLFKEWR